MVSCRLTLTGLICLCCCGPADEQIPAPPPVSQGVDLLGSLDLDDPDLFLVDLRDPQAFARRHVRGSINLQWGFGQFEERVGRLFPPGGKLVIYHPDTGRVQAAMAAALAAGFTEVQGHAADPAEMPLADELVGTQATLSSQDLDRRMQEGEILILDVRTSAEYAKGHIPGAVFVYPDDIRRIAPALRADHPIAVICAAGWRSSMVTSWLARRGASQVFNAIGGMQEWQRLGLPIEKGSDQVSFR